ncbi:MAG: PEP-CTERM sorting domain-containing protein, partial [Pirellulales bacterium]
TGERFTSTIAQQVPNDGVWHHYEFSLAEVDLSHVRGTVTYTDGADFLVWQQQFSGDPNPLSSKVAVPEPATWLLLALTVGWLRGCSVDLPWLLTARR